MKKLRPLIFLILTVLSFLDVSVCAQPRQAGSRGASSRGANGWNAPAQRTKPYVILVGIDGFRADYLDLFETPNLKRIIQSGVRAQGMLSIFPSKTLPNLYAIVTGMDAERHGMVSNSFYDSRRREAFSMFQGDGMRDGSFFSGEPIWVTAEKQGMVTAPYSWVGAEAAIKGLRGSYWRPYDNDASVESRVETVLGWLRFPVERRPHFLTLYFSNVDSAGHQHGPATPEVRTAIETVDKSLGTLLDGIDALEIRGQIYIIVVSDHGMSEVDPARYVGLESIVDVNSFRTGDTGPLANLYVNGGVAAAHALRDQINGKLEHGRAYLRAEVPAQMHYRRSHRIGDVVIIMDEHYQIGLEQSRPRNPGGNHGWDPALSSMRGLFLATGPGLRKGATIPTVRNVDIYPFITEILRLKPAREINGQPGVLRKLCAATPRGISSQRNGPSMRGDGRR